MKEKPVHPQNSEAARRLAAIFDNAVDGLIIIDEHGIIEQINPSAARLFGYQADGVLGKNVKFLMPAPDQEQHDTYLQNYHQTGVKKIIGIGREVQGLKKDGSVFPFFLSISEIQLDERKIYTGFIHDTTALRQKEAELAESRNRLASIFETAVDGIIIINKRGIIQSCNPAVSQLFGYEQGELIGENVSLLMPQPHRAQHDTYIQNYQRTGQAKIIGIGREVYGKRKDGSEFPFSLGVSEVRLSNGNTIYTGIIHDLSARKAIEDKIRQLNNSLEQKITMRTKELSNTVNKLLSVNKTLEFEIQERKKAEAALRVSEMEVKNALQKEKE
ncbi:MAG: PAS domain S-box protein, partial [Bacteroidota bacterium]